ncbi:hypothetical protein [Salinimicrobium sp. GXAS 041]|uniref:hypothetical protein n=1 Tax=Salinimicrobium sp. GXAS 041 TaxID=3400806 RepID=UPI003C74C163
MITDPSNLEFIDTKELKFSHTKEGVVAKYQNKKIIISNLTISKKDNFTDDKLLALAKGTFQLQCAVRGWPVHKVEKSYPVSPKQANDYTPFSKYVSDEIFEKYIKKGIWQLGTIEQYKTIENKKQRDEFEGISYLNLDINEHLVSVLCTSGYNYLIFCGTNSSGSTNHQTQFGGKELFFPNVRSFAEAVKKSINAKRYFIQKIEYNTFKFYVNKNSIIDSQIDLNNVLTPRFFEVLKDHLVYPSLFVKPEFFTPENEVRIVFEMPKDYKKPLRFENRQLLDYIKY